MSWILFGEIFHPCPSWFVCFFLPLFFLFLFCFAFFCFVCLIWWLGQKWTFDSKRSCLLQPPAVRKSIIIRPMWKICYHSKNSPPPRKGYKGVITILNKLIVSKQHSEAWGTSGFPEATCSYSICCCNKMPWLKGNPAKTRLIWQDMWGSP